MVKNLAAGLVGANLAILVMAVLLTQAPWALVILEGVILVGASLLAYILWLPMEEEEETVLSDAPFPLHPRDRQQPRPSPRRRPGS